MAANSRAPSVVLATFNGERFVAEQLQSLFRQTLAPAEIIVCDDGSTDATLDVVRALARQSPAPLHVRRNPSRLGYADNFLLACQGATSDLIAFCDQDDVWREDKLELCANRFADPATQLVAHRAQLIDEAGAGIGDFDQEIGAQRIVPPLGHAPWKVYFGYSMVFRKSLLDVVPSAQRAPDQAGRAQRLAHDRWVLFLANISGNTVELADRLVQYRQHGRNVYGFRQSHGALRKIRTARQETASHLAAARALRGCVDLAFDGPAPPQRVERAAAARYWDRVADQLQLRADIYAANSPFEAAARAWRAVLGGAYDGAASAGYRGLLRDLAFTALPGPLRSRDSD